MTTHILFIIHDVHEYDENNISGEEVFLHFVLYPSMFGESCLEKNSVPTILIVITSTKIKLKLKPLESLINNFNYIRIMLMIKI